MEFPSNWRADFVLMQPVATELARLRNENRELQRDVADPVLAERIETMWERVRRSLWWPRVWNQLHNEGVHVDRKRVTRIRRQ